MVSSSSFNPVDSFALSLHDEIGPSSAERGLGLCRKVESFAVQAPIRLESQQTSHDRQLQPFFPRSSKCMIISGFAIAATTAVGLSIFSLDGFAIAAELDASSTTTIVSVARMHDNPSQRESQIQNDSNNPNPASFPSIVSNPTSDVSLSMAIPIPHEQEWIIVRKGYSAPLPRMQKQRSSSLKCPQWTPSELEMVLPDFNGRPKPFPRQGHHWFASFAVRGTNSGEAFLQFADLRNDVENGAEIYEKVPLPIKTKLDKEEMEGKLTLLKMLGMERLTCFSM